MASCPAQQAVEAHLEEVLWAGQGRCEKAVHVQAEALQAAAATSSALRQNLKLYVPHKGDARTTSR